MTRQNWIAVLGFLLIIALVPDSGFVVSCNVVDEAMDYLDIPQVEEHLAAVKKDLLRIVSDRAEA